MILCAVLIGLGIAIGSTAIYLCIFTGLSKYETQKREEREAFEEFLNGNGKEMLQ